MRIPPEVTAIPVVDIPPTEVCLAWKTDRRSDAIRDLVATALAMLPQTTSGSARTRHL
jgi:hypothetical protein